MIDEHIEAVFGQQASDFEQPVKGASWRLAKSLVTLRDECNAAAPNRSRVLDGTIGDAAHASRPSRHNPNNAGVVCALDVTHDPAGGMDTYLLFDRLRRHPHPDLEYVISNRRIASRSRGWVTRVYTGASPHAEHIHVAVGRGPDLEPTAPYDDVTAWGIATPVDPFPYGKRTLKVTTPRMTGLDVLWVQQQMNKLKTYPQDVTPHLNEDSIYGPETAHCVDVFQYRYLLTHDGIVGARTWAALRKETGND